MTLGAAECFRPEQSKPLYPKASQLLKEPTKKRTSDEASLDQALSSFVSTPLNYSLNKTYYNPHKRMTLWSKDGAPTINKATNTDDGINELNQAIISLTEATEALGSSPNDIEGDNTTIVIAPPSVTYVRQRPTILGRAATNLTVIRDTVEDFVSHQDQNIKDIQHTRDTYKSHSFSSYRLEARGLVATLRAHKVIKAKAEAMLECLPEEQPSSPFKTALSLSLDSRRPVTSSMEEGSIKLLHRPSTHIFVKQIDSGASINALPTANSGFSSSNMQQQQEVVQSNQGLLDLFRALLRKAKHSRIGSKISTSDEFPFLLLPDAAADNQRGLRNLSLGQHQDHREGASWTASSSSDATDAALKALKHLNVNAGEAYVALCEALQESLNTPEP